VTRRRHWVPERGDLVWLDFVPQVGHEQTGRRPAVVLSPGDYNGKVGLALVCPITSHVKGYPFEVLLPTHAKISGVALADQIKSLDWQARRAEHAGRLPAEAVEHILARARLLLA